MIIHIDKNRMAAIRARQYVFGWKEINIPAEQFVNAPSDRTIHEIDGDVGTCPECGQVEGVQANTVVDLEYAKLFPDLSIPELNRTLEKLRVRDAAEA